MHLEALIVDLLLYIVHIIYSAFLVVITFILIFFSFIIWNIYKYHYVYVRALLVITPCIRAQKKFRKINTSLTIFLYSNQRQFCFYIFLKSRKLDLYNASLRAIYNSHFYQSFSWFTPFTMACFCNL